MELPWVDHTDILARIGREPSLCLQLTQAGEDPRRVALEDFIRQRFAEHYGARVRHFMPCLLGLHGDNGQVQGAVGLRSAQRRPLFLERYLDEPIELAVARRSGRPVPREEIVEVGNLAAFGSASARLLIVALTDLLVAQGFRWVVFTGTPEGFLKAFDAKTGAELWKFNTGSGIVGSPVTWEMDGEQYVSVVSGWGGAVPLWGGEVAKKVKDINQGGMLWVFKLPKA